MITPFARNGVRKAVDPLASALSRLGISASTITVVGMLGVVASSLVFVTRGQLLMGLILITLFCFTDFIDGAVARVSNGQSKWGALLDSTADRISDAAIFGSLAFWLATESRYAALTAALLALTVGFVVSYVKARAESLGAEAGGGFAGRLERLLILGLGGLAAIIGAPIGIDIALWILAVLGFVTVGQRMMLAWGDLRA